MKKIYYRTVFVIVISGFTANPLVAQTLGDVERRLDRLEGQISVKARPSGLSEQESVISNSKFEKILQSFAEFSERLQVIERQIAVSINNLEQLSRTQSQIDRDLIKLKADTELQINSIEKKINLTHQESSNPKNIHKVDLDVDVKSNTPEDAKGLLKTASDYFKNEQWQKAEYVYLKFVSTYPKNDYISEAQYNLGRAYAAQDKHAEAAKVFLGIFQNRPKDSFVPVALLGLAHSLYQMKPDKNGQACGVYNEIEKSFWTNLTKDQKQEVINNKIIAECS
jgi:TolA-binding protein